MTKTLNQYNLTSFQLIEKAIENGEAHLSAQVLSTPPLEKEVVALQTIGLS